MKLLLIFVPLIAYAQVTVNAPAVTLSTNGATNITAWMSTQRTNASTALVGAIDASVTSITIENTTGITTNSTIVIDSEHMDVVAISGPALTVVRGYNGTVAASHLNEAKIGELKYRTFNNLGKALIVNALRQIVRDQARTNIDAAVAANQADADAAVQ